MCLMFEIGIKNVYLILVLNLMLCEHDHEWFQQL